MSPSDWTPYAHEDVRVHLLWRKRILVGLILASLFLVWAMSLGVTTETEQRLSVYGGEGSSTTITKPEEQEDRQPAATLTISPGETARLNDPVSLGNGTGTQRQGSGGAPAPDRPSGIPFIGILMLAGPFLAAVYAYRQLSSQGDVAEVNYGIYKGAMPLEKVTASHADLVRTGQHVEENPFGKRRGDYLRDAGGRYRGFADVEPPYDEPQPE